MSKTGEKFQTKLGFILSCVGSAVGMANIWAFPYRVGKYGGAVFLIIYFMFIALFSAVGLSAEFVIGRRSGTGTLGSYEYAWNDVKKGKLGYLLAYIPLLGSMTIAIGYAIIASWVLRSFGASVTGELLKVDAELFFSQATEGNFVILPWHIAVIIGTLITIFAGAKGIEKTNKIMMPIFFVLFLVLAVRVAFLPNAIEGYKYLLIPDWKYLYNIDTWINAMGQAFFSLSITGSGMIVCGAYLNKKEDIVDGAVKTGIYDTIAAMISAVVVIPASFAFGYSPSAGPSLMFITLPNVFRQMPFGQILAILFFISVVFAALTSLQNMFEVVVESLQTRFKITRTMIVLILGLITLVIGIYIEPVHRVGPWMDVVSIYIIPLGAVIGAVSWFWLLKKETFMEELNLGSKVKRGYGYHCLGKYMYVPLTLIVFILGVIYGGL
ncbi:MAG: sodium-dependent transporter [Fusobacterium gastrosuis]|uniref:sodium-dependent transporter n=1 Tax=Fusobacterium gastrosuis TaxID=1755100 RepID=UPI002A908448|nr:sodium-dependent transporter [Fusobacterium gastrosuis]